MVVGQAWYDPSGRCRRRQHAGAVCPCVMRTYMPALHTHESVQQHVHVCTRPASGRPGRGDGKAAAAGAAAASACAKLARARRGAWAEPAAMEEHGALSALAEPGGTPQVTRIPFPPRFGSLRNSGCCSIQRFNSPFVEQPVELLVDARRPDVPAQPLVGDPRQAKGAAMSHQTLAKDSRHRFVQSGATRCTACRIAQRHALMDWQSLVQTKQNTSHLRHEIAEKTIPMLGA